MEYYTVITENWFTGKARSYAQPMTIALSALIAALSLIYWSDAFSLADWLVASPKAVFTDHQYWRAWSTVFIHSDLAHFLSNMILFIPLAYALTGYFHLLLFPVIGFALGGLTNLIVLSTLGPEVHLLGASGVVYWMGATWLTLYALIENRDRSRKLAAKVLIAGLILFFPQTFHAEVSYLSHFIGFVFGIISALVYYFAQRHVFARAVRREIIWESDNDLQDFSNTM